MNHKVGVLFVSNFPSNTGYAWNLIERYFQALAEVALQKNMQPYICYPELSHEYPVWIKYTKVKVLHFDYGNRSLRNLISFLKLLRKKRIKVIYFVDQPTASLRYFFMRLAGVKRIIVHDHTSGKRTKPVCLKRIAKQAIHRISWLSANLYIAVSNFVGRRLVSVNCVPSTKVKVVYNGVDITKYRPLKNNFLYKELGISPASKIVFCAARANYYKGIHVLIKAAKQIIHKGYSDIYFVYCGDGPDLEKFRKKASLLGLRERFLFLGKRQDIPDLLKSSDIVVVPSIWEEAFGLTVIEGMACGKPVIATNVGGIPEIVEHGINGILIKPNNSCELAKAICKLLNNQKKRESIGINARQYVIKNFNINKSIHQLRLLFLKELEKYD